MSDDEPFIGEPSVDVFREDDGWVAQYDVELESGPVVFHGRADNIPDALRDLADEMTGGE